MKKYILTVLLLSLALPVFASPKNFVVYLKDNSRILSSEFDKSLIKPNEKSVYNPYLRVKDLNIAYMTYTSAKDKLKHHILADNFNYEISEIDFQDTNIVKKNTHNLKFVFRDKSSDSGEDGEVFKYRGFSEPTSDITVLRYDSYNETWVPEYLDLNEIDKIEFRFHEEKEEVVDLGEPGDKKNKDGKKTDEKETDLAGKKVLFSSDSYNKENISNDLKDALTAFKNNTKGMNSAVIFRVNFDVNSSKLNQESIDFLNRIGDTMKAEEFYHLRFNLRGFTDSSGKSAYNKKLSEKRAYAVKNYLVRNKNIAPSRLHVQGLGEMFPISSNKDSFGKSLNRRVEISPVQF